MGAPSGTSQANTGTPLQTQDKEGFQEVTNKKKRGRPRDLDRPEVGNVRIDRALTRSQSIAASTQGDPSITVAASQTTEE